MTAKQRTVKYGENKSCWQCRYQRLDIETTFLGICTWFSCHGRKDKDIPPEKVDEGCKFFIPKMAPCYQYKLAFNEY